MNHMHANRLVKSPSCLVKIVLIASVWSISSLTLSGETSANLTASSPDVEYPLMMRKQGVQGAVKLSYDIDENGRASNIQQLGKANKQLFLAAKQSLAKEVFDTDASQPLTGKQRIYRFNLTNLDEKGRLIPTPNSSKMIAVR